MTTIARIYDDLTTAMSHVISEKQIFLGERPDTAKDGKQKNVFAVIELPVNISDVAIGNRRLMLYTSGIFYLFSRAKSDNTLNINALSDFTESVWNLFPISGNYIVASNPEILSRGKDGYGYQVVSISFDLHSK